MSEPQAKADGQAKADISEQYVPDIFTGEDEEPKVAPGGTEAPNPVDPPKEPPPEPPAHPRSLVKLARQAGITEATITALTTAQLDQLVDDLSSRAEPPPAGPAEPADPEVTFADLDLGVNADTGKPYVEDDFDPGFLRFMKNQVKQTRALQRQLEQQTRASERTREVELIDQAFDRIGNEAAFGRGGIADLADEGHRLKRDAAVSAAVQMAGPGASVADIARHLPKAAEALFGKAQQQQPQQPQQPAYDLQQKQEQWRAGALARPTHRQVNDLPPGEEKARAGVQQYMEQHGVTPGEQPTTLDEFL